MILNRYNIEISIINIKTKIFFKFLDEQNRERDLRTTNSNKALNKILIKISAKFLYLIITHIVQCEARRKRFFFKINNVIIDAMLEQDIDLFLREHIQIVAILLKKLNDEVNVFTFAVEF